MLNRKTLTHIFLQSMMIDEALPQALKLSVWQQPMV